MWWYKIPVLLIVATASHISLSDRRITKLGPRSSFTAFLLLAFEVCPSDLSVRGCRSLRRGTLKGSFWALTACEVALIWSVNHLRSPVAHRILVVLIHPLANFPPNPRITLPFSVGLSISILSLAIRLVFNSHHRRISKSPATLDQARDVPRRRIQITRRVFLGGNISAMAIGPTLCYVGPGSFVYECWVWRMKFWGTFLCLIGVAHVVFWLVVIWRFVVSQRGSGTASPDTGLEGNTEVLVMERVD